MSFFKKSKPSETFANEIRRQIHDGLLEPGNYLLPERELARKHGVSLRVVRGGLAALVSEKLIRRSPRSGTVVLPPSRSRPQARAPKSIAWVIPGRIRDTSGAEMCDVLQQGFQAHGYGTVLYSSDNIPEKETEIFRQLVRDRIPGAVVFSAHPCTRFEHLAEARAAGMKLVLVDHDFPGFACDSVSVDDQLGAYEATAHLIRLGCERLLHVTFDTDWTSVALRRKGFEAAAKQLGHGVEARVLVVNRLQFADMVRRELSKLLPSARGPVGVFVINDGAALRVVDLLREGGYRVPQDVAVVGFNNDLEGAIAEVPLTSVEIPREEIAERAVQCLMEQLQGARREPKRIRLKPRLVIRQSCGCYIARENAGTGEKDSSQVGLGNKP